MAKLDYERDYYGDLELPPTADVTEIKKQFKKLALKYHPDRNPGREDEVKDKFVVIQAAHEILTDSALKSKVDAYRRRPGSRFPAASGVKGNPYQDLAKEMSERYGAPPTRRAAQPAPTRPTAARPAATSSSSSRYSNWGVPPTAKQKMADASDHLRAWDRMRTTSGRDTGSNGPSPTSPRPSTENTKPPQAPRTASQARRAEAAFGTKKTGYAPKSPLGGDEPPVTNKNYYTNLNSNLFNQTAENLRKSRPASSYADPLSTQFGDNYSDNRQRTPYASHIGEKTNPFEGVSVNRAKSARDAFRGQFDSDEASIPPRPQRQRSASVDESDRFKKPAEKSAYDGKPASPRYQSRASARYSPHGTESAPTSATFAPSNAANPLPTKTPGETSAYTRLFSGDTFTNIDSAAKSGGTSNGRDGSTVYDDPFSFSQYNVPYPEWIRPESDALHSNRRASEGWPWDADFYNPSSPSPDPPSSCIRVNEERSRKLDFKHEIPPCPQSRYPSSHACEGSSHLSDFRYNPERPARSGRATPSGERSPGRGMNTFERGLNTQLHHLLGKLKRTKQSAPGHDDALSPKKTSTHRVAKRTNANQTPSFTIPIDEDTFGPTSPGRFMRSSADNINTRFVAEEKAGENFMFNAGGGESPDAFLRAKQRSRSAPRGRHSPQRTRQGSSTESLGTHQEEIPSKPSAFNPDEWAGGFEPHHFVPPPVNRPSVSPTRANRVSKKTRPVRQTAGTAGLVDEEESSSEERLRPGTAADGAANGAASPMAMDIDSPPPEPIIPPVTGARTINVEPTKPEWRAGNVNGVKPTERKVGNGTSTPKGPDLNKAGSEDAPDFLPNLLADFKKVEPFAPPQPGLNSLSGLASTLPFPSQASSKLPLEKERPKLVLRQFPQTPTAPRSPTVLGVSSLKPSRQTWEKYVRDFEQYLREWAVFNNRILDHFQARRRVIEEKKLAWAANGNGYSLQEYLNWLEEDRLVRQKWSAACDAHELHTREMSKNMERMNS